MTNEPKLPTVVTETEGEWARDAAYALDHIGDPTTFTAEAMETAEEQMDVAAISAHRKSERMFVMDFERFIHELVGLEPRKEPSCH